MLPTPNMSSASISKPLPEGLRNNEITESDLETMMRKASEMLSSKVQPYSALPSKVREGKRSKARS